MKRHSINEDKSTLKALLEMDIALPIDSERFNAQDVKSLLKKLDEKSIILISFLRFTVIVPIRLMRFFFRVFIFRGILGSSLK
jgi:hypothetical protein